MEERLSEKYFDQIEASIKSMVGTGRSRTYCPEKARKKYLTEFEAFIGRSVSKSMAELFQKSDGFAIEWVHHQYDYTLPIYGHCFVRSLNSFVYGQRRYSSAKAKRGERHKQFLWDEGDDPDLIKELEDHYFILDVVELTAGVYTLFRFEPGKDEPLLSLYKYPNYFYPLTIGFKEYSEISIEVRSLSLWQDYFIDREQCDREALDYLDWERPDHFFKNIKYMFPAANLSRFPSPVPQPGHSFATLAKEKNYAARFQAKFEELEEKVKAADGTYDFRPNSVLNIAIIRKVEKVLGRRLPDSLLAFYSQLNGFELHWSYPDKERYGENPSYYPEGNFHLLPLEDIFGGEESYRNRHWHDQMHEGIVTMEEVMIDEELDFAKECRLMCNAHGHDNETVLRFVEGKEEPELYAMERGEFFPLELTFTEYIECLLETVGMDSWPLFRTNRSDYSDHSLKTQYPVVKYIKDLFPDTDVSKYRQVVTNIELEQGE